MLLSSRVRSRTAETPPLGGSLSLPGPLKEFVDGHFSTGRYSSASAYVCELIRSDAKRKVDWNAIRSKAPARVHVCGIARH